MIHLLDRMMLNALKVLKHSRYDYKVVNLSFRETAQAGPSRLGVTYAGCDNTETAVHVVIDTFSEFFFNIFAVWSTSRRAAYVLTDIVTKIAELQFLGDRCRSRISRRSSAKSRRSSITDYV